MPHLKSGQQTPWLGFVASFAQQCLCQLRRPKRHVSFANCSGVHFPHQAKFHPLKYLEPLVSAIPGDGSFVFEHTAMEDVDDKPMVVHTGGRKIRRNYLVIATHSPLTGQKGTVPAALFQSKLILFTSYVLGARVSKGTGAGSVILGYRRAVLLPAS